MITVIKSTNATDSQMTILEREANDNNKQMFTLDQGSQTQSDSRAAFKKVKKNYLQIFS